jgi:hypothetical protein
MHPWLTLRCMLEGKWSESNGNSRGKKTELFEYTVRDVRNHQEQDLKR